MGFISRCFPLYMNFSVFLNSSRDIYGICCRIFLCHYLYFLQFSLYDTTPADTNYIIGIVRFNNYCDVIIELHFHAYKETTLDILTGIILLVES